MTRGTHDMTRPYHLGMIGLGIMGAPMVRRLRAEGWEVTVWNLEPERYATVEESGAVWADSPAAVRAASDVVMLCVLGDAAIESVCLGPQGLKGASGAATLIDFSTTSAEATRTIAEKLGMDWLDVPMSGGPGAAESGTLTLMAGGEQATFDAMRPIFESLAGNTTLMGPLGAGQMTKVLNQAICGANYLVLAEALALAERAGIDAARLGACLAGGMADSVMLQRVFPQMQARDFDPPRSYARQLNKDLHTVGRVVNELGLTLPVLETSIAQYDKFTSDGNEMVDSAAVARLYIADKE